MPTFRQKKALDKVVENGGNISKAMEAAGYSPKTAKTPQKLTESKGWKELMDKYLPDKLLVEKHKALLEKQEVRIKNNMTTGEIEIIPTGEIDANSVKAGLDMAYKIKGSYAPEKKHVSFENDDELSDEDRELLNIINEHTRKSKK